MHGVVSFTLIILKICRLCLLDKVTKALNWVMSQGTNNCLIVITVLVNKELSGDVWEFIITFSDFEDSYCHSIVHLSVVHSCKDCWIRALDTPPPRVTLLSSLLLDQQNWHWWQKCPPQSGKVALQNSRSWRSRIKLTNQITRNQGNTYHTRGHHNQASRIFNMIGWW